MIPDHPKLTLDSLHEEADSPVKGLVHRYPDKALFLRMYIDKNKEHSHTIFEQVLTILATSVCPTYCMFCTRSYAVGADTDTVTKASLKPTRKRWEEAFAYIESQPALHDIVVSGGDSYYLAPEHLVMIGERLINMPNIRRFRFASKGLAVAPTRILDSSDGWVNALIHVSNLAKKAGKAMAVHTHFNHPNEISWVTRLASRKLLEAGVTVRNQTVLLKGVNDDVGTMSKLIRELADNNIFPVGPSLFLVPGLPIFYPAPTNCKRLKVETDTTTVLRLPVRHGRESGAPPDTAADDPGPGGADPGVDSGLHDAAVRGRPARRRRETVGVLL
jgi:lysine 2,3-aminomutase